MFSNWILTTKQNVDKFVAKCNFVLKCFKTQIIKRKFVIKFFPYNKILKLFLCLEEIV